MAKLSVLSNYKFLIRISCALVLLGRGWEYLFWDHPFRTILWSQDLLAPFVEGILGIPWETYTRNLSFDKGLNFFASGIGVYLFGVGILCLFTKKKSKILERLVLIAFGILCVHFSLIYMGKAFYFGILIEHSIQLFIPLIYLKSLKDEIKVFWLKVMIALTFIGHGLFAIGLHPIPGNFIDMIINTLGVTESIAINILFVMGLCDFVSSAFLFSNKTEKYSLIFMTIWGSVTALARVVSLPSSIEFTNMLHQWLMEVIFRIPHGLIPLALLSYLWAKNTKEIQLEPI